MGQTGVGDWRLDTPPPPPACALQTLSHLGGHWETPLDWTLIRSPLSVCLSGWLRCLQQQQQVLNGHPRLFFFFFAGQEDWELRKAAAAAGILPAGIRDPTFREAPAATLGCPILSRQAALLLLRLLKGLTGASSPGPARGRPSCSACKKAHAAFPPPRAAAAQGRGRRRRQCCCCCPLLASHHGCGSFFILSLSLSLSLLSFRCCRHQKPARREREEACPARRGWGRTDRPTDGLSQQFQQRGTPSGVA